MIRAPAPMANAAIALILALSFAATPVAADPADPAPAGPADAASALFGAAAAPSAGAAAALGSYARGCLAGAVELPETGPGWQAMRLSRNRNWGHPAMVRFIDRLSRAAQGEGWAGLSVGDLSQPRGGPMTGGHRSHQIGLDADIWLSPPPRLDLDRAARERAASTSVVAADRRRLTPAWTKAHQALLRAAAEDPAVARIFVNAAIKARLCEDAPAGDRDWLRPIRPWWGHDAHFHVRLRCPEGEAGCVDQAPPPAGDGCDETLDWWFSDEVLAPPPPDPEAPPPPPPVELTLADLPLACERVLGAE